MLAHCNFCRWNCRVDRTRGAKFGACKLAASTRVSTYFHHPGEELVYRGTAGSGTIFFTSCNMRCAFCQNGDISTDKDNGEVTDARTLAAMAWLLRAEGAHNINWVGGEVTIHLHTIVEAIALLGGGFEPSRADLARALPTKSDRMFSYGIDPEQASYEGAFNAPMLWNSNFFMTDEAMKILRVLTDVWLPDFKFGPGRCAMTLAKTPWYWETVTGNLLLLRAWGENLTIRHLVMPNHVECCTYPVLDWIALHMPDVPVNVMDQYRPDNFCDPSERQVPAAVRRDRPPAAGQRDPGRLPLRRAPRAQLRDRDLRAESARAVRGQGAPIYIMSKRWAEAHDAPLPVDVNAGEENFASRHANGTGPFILKEFEPQRASGHGPQPRLVGLRALSPQPRQDRVHPDRRPRGAPRRAAPRRPRSADRPSLRGARSDRDDAGPEARSGPRLAHHLARSRSEPRGAALLQRQRPQSIQRQARPPGDLSGDRHRGDP